MTLPAGTITFLFSDVEGSTQLARQLGERYPDALAQHLRVLRTAFASEGAQEIDTQGDSLFVTFLRAKDAVRAAAAAQRALAEHAWAEGCELRVRRLKDFERPERLFQLVIHGLPSEFPQLRAQHHLGRLIDHVHLRVRDLETSRRFYSAVLEALGQGLSDEGEDYFSSDELYASDDGEPTAGLHLAFQARDRETVDRFYEAALAAGGRDNGSPGERRYHAGYYAAYVLDPDGNNVEAVHHGRAIRSVDSVVVTPEPD